MNQKLTPIDRIGGHFLSQVSIFAWKRPSRLTFHKLTARAGLGNNETSSVTMMTAYTKRGMLETLCKVFNETYSSLALALNLSG